MAEGNGMVSEAATFPGMDATLRWVNGVAFGADGMGGATLRIDQPSDEGGRGEGFKPLEILLHSLGACMATMVVKTLAKQRIAVASYQIDMHGERDPEMPHPFTRIVVEHTFRGAGLKRPNLERIVALAEEKYCSVSACLRPGLVENRVVVGEPLMLAGPVGMAP
ncbi:MAG: OsmC family protein [Chloroflexi bacterium]|nr:OsmC family protein [Chloroflexota bacterium]